MCYRDVDQLNGVLKEHPSEACKPYDYNDTTPIAPCGALANAMFQGNPYLYYKRESLYGWIYVCYAFTQKLLNGF